MDCPFCGKPLKEGRVFCESCGKEIQIVPVFEPEIEDKMKHFLAQVADVFEPHNSSTKSDEEVGKELEGKDNGLINESSKPVKKRFYLVLGSSLLILVSVTIVLINTLINYNSYDYQIKTATIYYDTGNYSKVLKHAKRAIAIAPNSSDARMLLANSYTNLDDIAEAKAILEELIANDSSYFAAYRDLINIYINEKEYEKINTLLKNCNDISIVEQFQSYGAFEPDFSEEEGIYDSVLSLKLLASGNGDVYYTLDGTQPDISSEKYMSPIRLENGIHTIKAVFINTYGVTSAVVSKTYEIQIATPDEPEISAESGSYTSPQMIETFLSDEYEIFYTTDGSEPTRNSNPYLVPIPMPLGHSVFKFIMYDDDGIASHVATREYDLQLDTPLTIDAAIIMLKQELIKNGSILNIQGEIPGMSAIKDFEIKSAFKQDVEVFYLITEYVVEMDGTRSKSGNHYAINVATNELYRASTNYAGYYMVEAFE